jgi:hypothetical protein
MTLPRVPGCVARPRRLLRIVDRLDPTSEAYDPVADWLLVNLIRP